MIFKYFKRTKRKLKRIRINLFKKYLIFKCVSNKCYWCDVKYANKCKKYLKKYRWVT